MKTSTDTANTLASLNHSSIGCLLMFFDARPGEHEAIAIDASNAVYVRVLADAMLIELGDRNGWSDNWLTTTELGVAVSELAHDLRRPFTERFAGDMDYAHGAYHDGWGVGAGGPGLSSDKPRRWESAPYRFGVAALWVASYYEQSEAAFGAYADTAVREISDFLLEAYTTGKSRGEMAMSARDDGLSEMKEDAGDSSRWAAPGCKMERV